MSDGAALRDSAIAARLIAAVAALTGDVEAQISAIADGVGEATSPMGLFYIVLLHTVGLANELGDVTGLSGAEIIDRIRQADAAQNSVTIPEPHGWASWP